MTDTLRATRPDHADTTGIYVRAVGLNGRWGSHDIAELDAPSLLAWLRSHDGMAENVVEAETGVSLAESIVASTV